MGKYIGLYDKIVSLNIGGICEVMLELIKSKYVREYVEKTGFKLSDMDFATIAYHSDLSIPEKHSKLREISNKTQDMQLKKQIEERLAFDEKSLRQFAENDGTCFYEVSARTTPEINAGVDTKGYFSSFEMAMECAKRQGVAVDINKYQLLDMCEKIILPFCSKYAYEVDEDDFGGNKIASFTYDANGTLESFWTYEMPKEERDKVGEDWGGTRFESRFMIMPNPFEKGDIVRELYADGNDKVGIVATSQDEWESDLQYIQELQEQKLVFNYVDTYFDVLFFENDGSFSKEHIAPIYLEKVEENNAFDVLRHVLKTLLLR